MSGPIRRHALEGRSTAETECRSATWDLGHGRGCSCPPFYGWTDPVPYVVVMTRSWLVNRSPSVAWICQVMEAHGPDGTTMVTTKSKDKPDGVTSLVATQHGGWPGPGVEEGSVPAVRVEAITPQERCTGPCAGLMSPTMQAAVKLDPVGALVG